jgi:CHASE2 domain-containing sensor protein
MTHRRQNVLAVLGVLGCLGALTAGLLLLGGLPPFTP